MLCCLAERGSICGAALTCLLLVSGCGRSSERAAEAVTDGLLRQKMQQHALAIEDFSKALLSDPKNAEAWCYRGRSYAAVGNPTAAANNLREAIRLKPEWPEPWWALGTLHRDQKKFVTAIRDFTAAIRLDPRMLRDRIADDCCCSWATPKPHWPTSARPPPSSRTMSTHCTNWPRCS